MSGAFLVAGSILALVAAGIHVVIFFFESVLWMRPAIWRRFGVRSVEDAGVLRPMALNQGFYNVCLAVGTIIGLVLIASGLREVGLTLALSALLSMLLASIVLIGSNRRLARAAAFQGTAPLLGSGLLLLAILTG